MNKLYENVEGCKNGNAKLLKKYSDYKLLIVDEWLVEDISDEEQHFCLNL